MADLDNIKSSGSTKIVGSDNTGDENSPINSDYGTSSESLRTAAQVGNSSGEADFGSGSTSGQTLRTAANLQMNGADVSDSNQVPVIPDLEGLVDSGNSSTTPLGIGGVFTGSAIEILGYHTINVNSYSDQAGTLEVQFSTDSTNWDHGHPFSIPAGVAVGYNLAAEHRYVRMVYTNGDVAQTEFRLQTILKKNSVTPTTFAIDDEAQGYHLAQTTKSVVSGQNPDGNYIKIRAQGEHSANSTSTPLAGDEVFRGEWFSWGDGYVKLGTVVSSDVDGTLYIDYSNESNPTNGVDTDITFSEPIPFDAGNQISTHYLVTQSRWVRARYINGPTAQSTFNLLTGFVTSDPGNEAKPLVEFPNNYTIGGTSRSVPTLKKSDGTGFQDWKVDSETENPEVTVRNVRDDILLKPLTQALARQFVVGLTPLRIDPVQVSNRRGLLISNDGPVNGAVGFSDSITYEADSFRMIAGAVRSLPFSESVELWAVSEDTGGTESTLTRSGSTATGTADSPSNSLTSDNTYSTIDANAETVEVSGFTAGTTNDLVSVKLGVEAKKESGQTQTVSYIDTVTGNAGNTGVVTTSTNVTAVQDQLYIAAVSRENPNASVVGVSGLGLTWTQVASITNTTERVLDVYAAIGGVSGDSVVQASFSQTAQNSHIAVSRYSGVDTTSPIESFSTNTGSGTAVSTAGISGTEKGMSYLAVAKNNSSFTPGAGYTEASDETTAGGGDRDGLATEYKPLVTTGTETPAGTLSTSINWAAISLTINPAEAVDPEIRISYEYSATPGTTSAEAVISSETDTNYLVDITTDRSWDFSEIANIEIFVEGTSVGDAAALIDYVFVELVDTTGSVTRFSVIQGGEEVA